MLKYWVDKKFIRLEDVKDPEMYKLVNNMIINPSNIPNGVSNIDLFDSNNIATTDLAPDLLADKKVSVYILRRSGKIDLYLVETNSPSNSEFNLQPCDSIIWSK